MAQSRVNPFLATARDIPNEESILKQKSIKNKKIKKIPRSCNLHSTGVLGVLTVDQLEHYLKPNKL